MVSPKVKIGLLVAAHAVGGLLLAWVEWMTNTGYALAGLYALFFADAGLLGMWGGLSRTRLAWRLPSIVAAIVLASVTSTVSAELPALVFYSVMIGLPMFVILTGLRYSRRRLRVVNMANESPLSEGLRFSIRQLLVATAIVAAVLGTGRIVRSFESVPSLDWLTILILRTVNQSEAEMLEMLSRFSVCFVVVELAIVWPAIGIGRPTPRLAVVIPTAFAVGAILAVHLGVLSVKGEGRLVPLFILSATVGLEATITAASLLVVRSCGWRLVCGNSVPADSTAVRA